MRIPLIAVIAFLLGSTPALAQPVPGPPVATTCQPRTPFEKAWSGFHLYEENDSLPLAGGDERYTQGLRAAMSMNRRALPCIVQGIQDWWLPGRFDTVDPTLTVFVGQNLYTPRIITSRTLEPGDRGFRDFNYLGFEIAAVTSRDRWHFRHALELSVGALGSEGLAQAAQGGLHAVKFSRIPKGWYSSGAATLGIYTQYRSEYLYRLGQRGPGIDVSAGPALEFGNVRTSAGLHGTIRAGINLTGFAPGVIRSGADADRTPHFFEAGGFYSYEARAILHTGLVVATPGSRSFEPTDMVSDRRHGGFVRLGKVRVAYARVERSAEYALGGVKSGKQKFGSVTASFEPRVGDSAVRDWTPGWFNAELGMGSTIRGPRHSATNKDGIGVQLAGRFKVPVLPDSWQQTHALFVGVDVAGAATEGVAIAGEPDNRDDVMVRQIALTLGLNRHVCLKPKTETMRGRHCGTVGLRVGPGVAAAARIQSITHPIVNGRVAEHVFDRPIPSKVDSAGWMAGAQFFPHWEPHVGIGIDVSYHRLGRTDDPAVTRTSFFKAILLVQLRTP